ARPRGTAPGGARTWSRWGCRAPAPVPGGPRRRSWTGPPTRPRTAPRTPRGRRAPRGTASPGAPRGPGPRRPRRAVRARRPRRGVRRRRARSRPPWRRRRVGGQGWSSVLFSRGTDQRSVVTFPRGAPLGPAVLPAVRARPPAVGGDGRPRPGRPGPAGPGLAGRLGGLVRARLVVAVRGPPARVRGPAVVGLTGCRKAGRLRGARPVAGASGLARGPARRGPARGWRRAVLRDPRRRGAARGDGLTTRLLGAVPVGPGAVAVVPGAVPPGQDRLGERVGRGRRPRLAALPGQLPRGLDGLARGGDAPREVVELGDPGPLDHVGEQPLQIVLPQRLLLEQLAGPRSVPGAVPPGQDRLGERVGRGRRPRLAALPGELPRGLDGLARGGDAPREVVEFGDPRPLDHVGEQPLQIVLPQRLLLEQLAGH